MRLPFIYKDLKGEVIYSFFTGRRKLFVGGQEIPKIKGGWQISGGRFIAWKQDLTFLPKLKIDGDEIKLIVLKKWEVLFILLPVLLVVKGGILGGLCGGVGAGINVGIFASVNVKSILKVLASLGVFILATTTYFIFAYYILELVR